MTNQAVFNNYGEWIIRGQIDLSAAAAVNATRGDNLTTVKTNTGEYTVTLKGTANLKLVETLGQDVHFCNGVPVTALGCRVSSVTQTSGTDDIVIIIKTSATGGGADTNVTGATTLSFTVVIRVAKLGNPL